MDLMIIWRALHVLSSVWFASGMIGRAASYAQATRATDLHSTVALLHLSERFERLAVIPGATAVLVFGLVTAWLQAQPLFGFLQGAGRNWLFVALLLYLSLIPIVGILLAPRRKRRLRAIEDSQTKGSITPELAAALTDKGVMVGRTIEFAFVAVIFVLMLTKPF